MVPAAIGFLVGASIYNVVKWIQTGEGRFWSAFYSCIAALLVIIALA